MPRIEASNIEEHIRLQTARILDAAGELFRAKGYRGTDMTEIASAIGLARNSLYRYYANKDHILLACVQRDMAPYLDEVRALETSVSDARERIDTWIDLQMDIATGPCHATMQMIGEVREASPSFRAEISALHEPPARVLKSAVATVLHGTARDAMLVSGMIDSMVRSAAGRAIDSGEKQAILHELKDSVARVLDHE